MSQELNKLFHCVKNGIPSWLNSMGRRDFLQELKKYYWNKPVFWSRSYCILTCGGAPLSVIKQYIDQQAGVD